MNKLLEELPVGNTEEIEDWFDRFEASVEVNDVYVSGGTDEIKAVWKKSLILSVIGREGYKLLKAYMAPVAPNTQAYEVLKKCITDNLVTKSSTVSESFKLSQLKQETAESLSLYMSRVKLAATRCDFGDSFDRMVRDKFICGLRNEKLRANLLSDDKVTTSTEALEKAMMRDNLETAAHGMNVHAVRNSYKQNVQQNHHNNQSGKKNNKSKPGFNNQNSGIVCSKCTFKGHMASECRTKCKYCFKPGHIVANCSKLKNKKRVNDVSEDTNQEKVEHTSGGAAARSSTSATAGYEYTFHVVVEENIPMCGYECPPDDTGTMVNADKVDSYMHSCGKDSTELSNSTFVLNSNFSNSSRKPICNAVHNKSICETSNLNLAQTPELINHVGKRTTCCLKVMINGRYVTMELDTGSEVTCISKTEFEKLNLTGCSVIKPSSLIVANGQSVSCVNTSVFVKYGNVQSRLVLRLVDAKFPTLLGRDWMNVLLGPDWYNRLVEVKSVKSIEETRKEIEDELKRSPIFQSGVGRVSEHEACLDLKEDFRPKFCKARPVAYAERDEIGAELDRLVSVGYYTPVDSSPWASPVVSVRKSDGSVRLCGDYKRTLNPNLDMMTYPLPTVEDCFVDMKGGQYFSKIDIKQVYNSLPLREQDQILATINTHKGLYKPLVLPYGINSASGIFQSVIDKVLKGLKHVICRVDDILITGVTTEEHICTLREVVHRLEKCGFKCRWMKCEFLRESVIYLAYEISKVGVKPCKSKIETLVKASYPNNLDELISFLGAVQYYSRLIENLSTLIEPLNRLRTAEWNFGEEEKACFDELKRRLTSDNVLIFYDPALPLRIDCDASSYGLGAVLSHVDENNVDRPIEFISRTLTPTERRYSQIDREALGIVWSIRRFHKYVYARPFELITDHEPLKYIYDVNNGIPEMVSSRVQRWAVTLSTYQFTVKYRSTKEHGNADVCSRFPLPETTDGCKIEIEDLQNDLGTELPTVFSLSMSEEKPLLNAELIARCTKKDIGLSKILHFVREGWPESGRSRSHVTQSEDQKGLKPPDETIDEYQAFYCRRNELSVEGDCLLWGHRVVIPEALRADMLKVLHSTHMGMTSSKQLARNYIWWPKLDEAIESMIKLCHTCQLNQKMPKKAKPHPWIRPENPWERIHIDYAGPFLNCMWMIVIDSYSKWLEVVNMHKNITAENTIRKLRPMFSRFGLCKILVSDNAPQLVKSEVFEKYCKQNGITHVPIPSYHPASNGAAESSVYKFKLAMKKMSADNSDIETNIAHWLINYHNTKHSWTDVEPAILMMGRRLRSQMSLVHPLSSGRSLKFKLHETTERLESETTLRRFQVGDAILYRDVLKKTWLQGTVLSASDKVYEIKGINGALVTKHIDHIVASTSRPDKPSKANTEESTKVLAESEELAETECSSDLTLDKTVPRPKQESTPGLSNDPPSDFTQPKHLSTENLVESRPKRTTKVPDRLNYDKKGG